MQGWPPWWDYDIVLSPHCFDRMQERDFTEIDVRAMLDDADAYRSSVAPGRFLISTRKGNQMWEVVVEPDEMQQILTIVTAYRVE